MIQFIVGLLIGIGGCYLMIQKDDKTFSGLVGYKPLFPVPDDGFIQLKPKQIVQFESFTAPIKYLTIKAVE